MLELLKKASAYLEKQGVESPRASAEILLADVLGMERIGLYVHGEQPAEPAELKRFREAILRRSDGEPTAYIVGNKEFWGMAFYVNPDALIPRPETEHLVEAALRRISRMEAPGISGIRVLDLGTGSGAVVIALAKHAGSPVFFASDISMQALQVARRNIRSHDLGAKIQLIQGDWFSPFGDAPAPFDIIVSNPPYIPTLTIPTLQPEIRHEPLLALDGGPDGLAAVREILSKAYRFLKPGGELLVEIGHDQKQSVERMVREISRYKNPEFIRDLAGWDRVLSLEKG